MRLGDDTDKPAVRLGWMADAVCPCAAVAATTAAVGTTLDECPAGSAGDTGGRSGTVCSVYPVRTSDRLLSLCITVCDGGDTGMTDAWVPIPVCGVPSRPKSAGSGGSAGDTGETIIRLTAFASDTLWF